MQYRSVSINDTIPLHIDFAFSTVNSNIHYMVDRLFGGEQTLKKILNRVRWCKVDAKNNTHHQQSNILKNVSHAIA